MDILLVSPQLTGEVEGLAALLTHRVLGLLVHLVDVLTEVGVLLVTQLTLQLELEVYQYSVINLESVKVGF